MIVIIALSAAAAFVILAAFDLRPHAKMGKRKRLLLQTIKLLAMIAILFALASSGANGKPRSEVLDGHE
jgi:hypothetical protein